MGGDKRKPTLEDVLELSGLEILHPGGLEITARIGEIVDMKGKGILDVACGRGILPCYYAKRFGARIVGVDISPEMIRSCLQRARREGVERLTEFRLADSLVLPFEDDRFATVVNECAVGLTSDPQRCLEEMARVTRPGGHVVIHESVWLKELPASDKAESAERLGTVPYGVDEWKAMMEATGLRDIWTEDWSALENMSKLRPSRKIKSPNDIFSPWEKAFLVLPRVVARFGIKGLAYINESSRKIGPLYFNGALGYFLFKGEKP